MKQRILNGALTVGLWVRAGSLRLVGARKQDTSDEAARWQGAARELSEVKRSLATSQQELQAAWQHIETLAAANSRLNTELIELAQREAQARGFAYHDELTGLPNRRLLLDRLSQAVAQGERQHKHVVLLLLDLDGFKSVNDKLGHAAGDKLLHTVAERLSASLRGADTACRYGGDEFVVMLPEVDHTAMAIAVETKLRAAVALPYLIDGFEIRMTASVGRVAYPTDGQTYEELMRKADDALYRAKGTKCTVSIKALPKETAGALQMPRGEMRQRTKGAPDHDLESWRQSTGATDQG